MHVEERLEKNNKIIRINWNSEVQKKDVDKFFEEKNELWKGMGINLSWKLEKKFYYFQK